jgi:beta-galactosidase/beta-glucuronidase
MEPHTEYPRPDFDRSHCWLSLNGAWDFAADPEDRGRQERWGLPGHAAWSQRIQVPFAWETPLSGVGQEWLPVGWYRRRIQRPEAWGDERTILHIGAAHYSCEAWLNGHAIGAHEGGYLPFSFDVTDALEDGAGDLILRVAAPLDKRFIPHGKQRSRPADDYDGVCFTPSSGIWQPVWLEGRSATFIAALDLRPGADLASIQARVTLAGPHCAGATLSLQIADQEPVVIPVQGQATITTTLPVNSPRRWTPGTPHLYDVLVRLESADGEDRVRGYTGLRSIAVQGRHLLLNGERVYLRGVLDQGYWPRGGYTAPDGDGLRRDVELTLAAGYNLSRKHIKLEDPRWLYWADRLGLLVWEEPPCVSRYSPASIGRFEAQLAPMVARDGNHPCIVLWGIYNEEWGLDWRSAEDPEKQEAVARAYDRLAAADHSRPIMDDSGWWHVKTDVLDWHYYDSDLRRWRDLTAAIARDATTWFGHHLGKDHWYETQLWVPGQEQRELPLMNGEYGGGGTTRERGWHLRWQTQELRRHDVLSGYIYTEIYDVEQELCGVYTFDREPKDLDCDPAAVNADTVILFDLIPERPDCDVMAPTGTIDVPVQVSHHGPDVLTGRLTWTWNGSHAALGQQPLAVQPFVLTASLSVHCTLPAGVEAARLQFQVIDDAGRRRAAAFLDVARLAGNA